MLNNLANKYWRRFFYGDFLKKNKMVFRKCKKCDLHDLQTYKTYNLLIFNILYFCYAVGSVGFCWFYQVKVTPKS